MQGILASSPARKPLRPVRLKGRALSSRRVRHLVHIGQEWTDRFGRTWTVRQIHRKDALAAMEGPGSQPRYVSFHKLGRDYRPVAP